MTKRIKIYDTTLCDGIQSEGINLSVADKCRIVEELDTLGVDNHRGRMARLKPSRVFLAKTAKEYH